MHLNCLVVQRLELLSKRPLRFGVVRMEFQVPILLDADRVASANDRVSWLQLEDATENRACGWNKAVREERVQRRVVELFRDIRVREQAFELRGEDEAAAVEPVEKWRDHESVPHDEQAVVLLVPDGKSEHPA